MCLAYPGKIVSKQGDRAVIDFNGIKKDVNLVMVDADVDEYVMVHAGFAIEKMTDEDALTALRVINDSPKDND
ncbi:MAG: HypC/HybG/HupF family hydrogenase formation chaperone [Patescibacteria group bacterium]|nr:HypC/HybG/HupF family hydrogenase formation chaperone [Patescibacteria group bacterium]